MNKDKFEGRWNELKGKIKEKWGKLSDDDLTQINGKYDQFLGSLQKRYGYEKERAEKEFNDWNWGNESGLKNYENQETPDQFKRNQEGCCCEGNGGFKGEDTYKGQDREDRDIPNTDKDENDRNKKNKAG